MIRPYLILFGLAFCMACRPISPNQEFDSPDAYHQARQQLLTLDSLNDHSARISLNDIEVAVDAKLRQVQRQMLKQYQEGHFFPPGRYFYRSKAHMEASPLFQLLKRMPKGGLLHMHGPAILPVQWVLSRGASDPNCAVYWGAASEQYVQGELRFFRPEERPKGFFPLQQMMVDPDFEPAMVDLLTLDQETNRDSADIWMDFEHYFRCISGFINYQPVYRDYYRAAYLNLIGDGVQHVEIRTILSRRAQLYSLDPEGPQYPIDSILHYQQSLLDEIRQSHPDFSLKIIYTSLRSFGLGVIQGDIAFAHEIRQRYPELVVGYDLVGEEDAGSPTLDFLPAWLSMDSLQRSYQIDLPLYLHDGESNWASNDNLYDAVLLQSRRIGHGFNLYRYPALWEKIKRDSICIEVCPLSNQILGYVRDLRLHPAALYLRLGMPISISSDDPAPFGYEGVSPDYWSIFLAWELDLADLKQLSQNGILYSALSAEEKKVALKAWQNRWDAFIRYAHLNWQPE